MPDEQLPLDGEADDRSTTSPPTSGTGERSIHAPDNSESSGATQRAQRLASADGPVDESSRGDRAAPSASTEFSSRGGRRRAVNRAGRASDRRGDSTRRQVIDDPGGDLERRVGRTEFSDGALVRLRVPIRVDADSGRDVLTDIDVLAIDVDGRLRVSRSILECKSGKGQAGEPDRLLWLAGLQKFLGFSRAVLVRQTVSRRGRALARALGLRILDVPTLTARESAHAWVPARFAHIDGPECEAAERRTDTQLKALGWLSSELVAFLRYDALRARPHECLRAVASLGRAIAAEGVLPSPTRNVLAGHALTALMVAAVSDGGLLDEISAVDLLERTRKALVTGDPDGDQVLAILARADELTTYSLERVHSAYQEAGAKRLQVGIPSLREAVAKSPEWVPRYVDLVEKLRANPAIARQMLQTIELAVFEAMVGGAAHEAPAFDHLFTPEHRYLLNVAHHCLTDIAGQFVAHALAPALELNFDRGKTQPGDRDVPSR